MRVTKTILSSETESTTNFHIYSGSGMLSFTNHNISPLSLSTPVVPVNTCIVDLLSLALAHTASSTSLQLPLLTTCHWGTTLLYM